MTPLPHRCHNSVIIPNSLGRTRAAWPAFSTGPPELCLLGPVFVEDFLLWGENGPIFPGARRESETILSKSVVYLRGAHEGTAAVGIGPMALQLL